MADAKYISKTHETGTVSYSEEVISTIAAEALGHVDGVHPVKTKHSGHSIRVKVAADKVTLECAIRVEYGKAVEDVAKKAQSEVAEAVTSMTGLEIAAVNITVSGIVSTVRNAE
ncbi:MAG: Asp23/Gls24 family envelope stress response protein [Oscillospiraceae bacterium]|jgi:uncharacterized alkaline shock family protein YloU|nr:Asp23/Gls24 family envelope stress response protein [Oscillospiraceae bacterium]